jgi:hypothetical protein
LTISRKIKLLKLTRLLAEFLVQHKSLKLQGIGVLTVDETVAKTPEQEKEGIIFATDSIHFTENRKLGEDKDLIGFISRETGKIMPLAASDLDSYLELGKQFINISKPFILEGIGVLQKNGQNKLEFTQGDSHSALVDQNHKKAGRPGDEEVNFEDNYLRPVKKNAGSFNTLAIASLILLGLALMGWVASYLYKKSNLQDKETGFTTMSSPVIPEPTPDTTKALTLTDTVTNINIVKDTVSLSANTTIKTEPGTFNLVLEIASRNRAVKRYADLKEWGHKVEMTTTDSINYKLFIPVSAPLSDTIRHRDSLSRFFGRKVWIETK